MRTSVSAVSFAAILTAISFQNLAVGGNLVVNGGFETNPPPLDGWIVMEGGTGGLILGLFAHSGAYSAEFEATRGTHDSLEQLVPTTPGSTYLVDFWLANPNNGEPPDNDFSVTFGGSGLLALVNAPYSGYAEYKFKVQAVGVQSALEFTGRNQPGAFFLDDVSVIEIPEPSTAVLGALGGLALLAYRRRRA